MRLSLKQKIIGLACGSALLPVVAMFFFVIRVEHHLNSKMAEELDQIAADNLSQITEQVYSLCKATDNLLLRLSDQSLNAAKEILGEPGRLEFSGNTFPFNATSPSGEAMSADLPLVRLDGMPLIPGSASAQELPVIRELRTATGGRCAIYLRMTEQGDMALAAASDPDEAEEIIQAQGRNQDMNAAMRKVLEGDTAQVRFLKSGHSVLAGYLPLKDKTGRVYGMLSVGLVMKRLQEVREAIESTRVGKQGYVWVLIADGPQKGKYVISKDGRRDGENIWDVKNIDGEYVTRRLINAAMTTKPGETVIERYAWLNPGEGTEAKMKIAAVTRFAPWNWVIGAAAYEDDFHAARHNVGETIWDLMNWFYLGGVLIVLIVIGVALYFGGRIANPLSHMVAAARSVAEGDLGAAQKNIDRLVKTCPISRRAASRETDPDKLDETGQLFRAVEAMIQSLGGLVGQVQRSGIQVTTSATEIAAQVRQLEETVNRQAAATNQVGATTREISATAGELNATVEEVREVSSETAELADSGQDGLARMADDMERLLQSTDQVQGTLRDMIQKTEGITGIVSTITKVADQTNLLSLNAAIEAEKAGEYGYGFSVVAQEIRRLADQTAVAALEIEKMVEEMSGTVTRGVGEMERFAEDVRGGVEGAGSLRKQLERILSLVQGVNFRFESVSSGMQSQSEAAGQISQSMSQLSESASRTSEAVREFNRTAGALNTAVQGLQGEVSRFKVGS